MGYTETSGSSYCFLLLIFLSVFNTPDASSLKPTESPEISHDEVVLGTSLNNVENISAYKTMETSASIASPSSSTGKGKLHGESHKKPKLPLPSSFKSFMEDIHKSDGHLEDQKEKLKKIAKEYGKDVNDERFRVVMLPQVKLLSRPGNSDDKMTKPSIDEASARWFWDWLGLGSGGDQEGERATQPVIHLTGDSIDGIKIVLKPLKNPTCDHYYECPHVDPAACEPCKRKMNEKELSTSQS